MKREEGVKIIEDYDGKCSNELIEDLCFYLNISVHDFWSKITPVINKNLFYEVDKNQWAPKFKVGLGI
jgi:hypothetical protein